MSTEQREHERLNDEEQIGQAKSSNAVISRRKLLASLGIAGAVLASEGVLGTSRLVRKAEAMAVNVLSVLNIASLRAIAPATLSANDQALVEGYYTAGDGGGGAFYWDASSTQTDNGGTVILPTGYSGTGRWKRIIP